MKTPTAEQIRFWRWQRQRLQPSPAPVDPATLLAETGWMRSVGGSGPYLGLFARGKLRRARVDAAVAALEIHELPSARGCTYLVPACDFAVALRAAQGQGEAAQIATAKKHLGVTDKEIDRLCRRIVDALDDGPADPKTLKASLGDAVRHLGDEGKKRGTTTTLSLGLGLLQSTGDIRRVPANGRLDQQRYAYARWTPNPLAKVSLDDAELARALGQRFFRWAGPATAAQLAWWAGLGVKAAKSAVAELGLVSAGDAGVLFADDLDALCATKPPKPPLPVALVGSLDNLFHPRREVRSLLDEGDAALKLPQAKESIGHLADLENHAIVAAGRLVGLWDYDAAAQEIVYATFAKVKVERAVAEMEAFVRDDLGDARSFSLDSPESRTGRLAALRKLSR
ncbi:MAG TPA: crosslink repair DNA glycosylase YcaQ family protein [Kofleriaceae bacterium]|nr:crosslink repair DNA glycosylase YcaQ family protein [Kofleriaceae bacterium]